jgi:2-isopropylmalate synthase
MKEVRLMDYKVRLLDARKGTAAKVRVLIQWTDNRQQTWSTVGVSDNVVEASWKALLDAMRLELMRLVEKDSAAERSSKTTVT